MTQFIIRRLIQSAILLWAVMTLSFILIHVAPGGPEAVFFSSKKITPADIEAIRNARGLNDPLIIQYFRWLWQTITFDFGVAYSYARRPTIDIIWLKLGPTFQLGLMSYLIAMLGIPLGIYAAKHRGKLGDNVVRIFTVIGSAVPHWWLGLIIIVVLSNTIRWFPQGQGDQGIVDWFIHIIIPATLLAVSGLVAFARFVRNETIEVLSQDYVRTAEAKGVPKKEVNRAHVLRNSLIPVVTLMGVFLPGVLSGAVLTETIFNWPGLGQLFIGAANLRDYSVLLVLLQIGTILTIIGALLSDIAYAIVDPRIRYN